MSIAAHFSRAVAALLLLGLLAPVANAQSGGTTWPESLVLRRFHPDYVWEGDIKAGALWAGSPEVRTRGRVTFRWLLDDNLVVGDYEQEHYDGGRRVGSWRAHYVAGWDRSARQYRAVLIDDSSWGAAAEVRLDGDRYIMISPPYPAEGGSAVARMTLRSTGPDTFVWIKEVSLNGEDWRITEEAVARAVHPGMRE